MIQKEGNSWTVRKKSGGKPLGTHPSKEHAERQVRAIYANENKKPA